MALPPSITIFLLCTVWNMQRSEFPSRVEPNFLMCKKYLPKSMHSAEVQQETTRMTGNFPVTTLHRANCNSLFNRCIHKKSNGAAIIDILDFLSSSDNPKSDLQDTTLSRGSKSLKQDLWKNILKPNM